MRLKLTIETNEQKIPFSYHLYLQAIIYKALDSSTAEFFHNEGFGKHKMFVYSELSGPYRIQDKCLVFTKPVSLYISSISSKMLNELYVHFTENKYIEIGKAICKVLKAEPVEDITYHEDHVYEISTLSPVMCYKTDENHFSTYFHPKSKDFENSILQNIESKYLTLYEDNSEEYFKILEVKNFKEVKVKYKESIYCAYNCTLKIEVSDKYLSLMMHTGIGSKNAAGFGMIEITG